MEFDRINNRFRYEVGGRSGVWSGRSIYTTPMSFFTSGRHVPGLWNLLPDRLFRLIFAGGADGYHTDSAGNKWGWDVAGNFQQTYGGSKSFFPFSLGDPSNRVRRTGFAFLPATNPPTMTRINVRGSNFIFHAGLDSTMVQFIGENNLPGTADARLVLSNSTLAGFSLKLANGPLISQPPNSYQAADAHSRNGIRLRLKHNLINSFR